MSDPYGFVDVAAALREIERRRLEGESSDDEMTPAIQQVAKAMATPGQWPGVEATPAEGETPEGWAAYREPEYLSQYQPTLRDKTAGVLLDWGAPRSFVEGTVGSMGAGRQGGMPLVDFAGATPFALDEYQRATAFPTREQLERSPGGPGMGNVFGPALDTAGAIPIPGAKAAAEAAKAAKKAAEDAAKGGINDIENAVAKTFKIAGAPEGVTTARQEAARRAAYLRLLAEGSAGRQWYNKVGANNLFLSGDDEDKARRLTGIQAVTSADTGVDANAGYAYKGILQRAAGEPLNTGKFFTEMSRSSQKVADAPDASAIYDVLGLKRGPYAINIAAGGGYGPPGVRAVHDIWDARAWGYSEKQVASGMKDAQHAWMDRQAARVIEQANKIKAGGHVDWDPSTAQAAVWVAKRAADKGLTIEEAAKDYSDYVKKYLGQGSYESIPGKSLQKPHLPGLETAGIEAQTDHLNSVYKILTDPKNRDKLTLGFGGLSDEAFMGPGVFEGAIHPGVQTQVPLGRAPLETGKIGKIDTASRDLMRAIEATRALLLGQDSFAFHYAGNASALIRTGIADFDLGLGRPVTNAEMVKVIDMVRDHFKGTKLAQGGKVDDMLNRIAPIPTPDGFRLVFHGGGDDPTSEEMKAFANVTDEIVGNFNKASKTNRETLAAELHSNDWKTSPLGQEYLKFIDRPEFEEAFNRIAPELARKLMELDAPLAAKFGGSATAGLQMVRKIIADGGLPSLRAAIKAGVVPVGAVGIFLGAFNQIGGMPLSGGSAGQPTTITG